MVEEILILLLSAQENIHYDYSGIYRDRTMADKLMYIPNDDTHNYPFCKLQLVVKILGDKLR